jgi:hypothetical protein
MISGMARFRGQLVLAPVPRGWLERFVNELYEAFVALEVQDGLLVNESGQAVGVRLAGGRHATVGARYQDAEANESSLTGVVLTGWDRTGETSVKICSRSDGGTSVCDVRLHSVASLRTVIADGAYRGARARPRRLGRVSWTARLDLEQWWMRAGRRPVDGGKAAPLIIEVSHPLARGAVLAVPHHNGDEHWTVMLTVRLNGRFVLRPLAAAALRFARHRIHRTLQQELDKIAKEWNTAIPDVLKKDPRDFIRREFLNPPPVAAQRVGRMKGRGE